MADRKISDLTALTTPASGDYLPIVDISEAAAASKNKRITIEELMRGVPDGTAAAPGIAFETDPNTGIYRPGADQLAVATNGTGRLFVDANGNVGVGGAPSFIFDTTQSVAAGYSNWGFRNTAADGYIRQQFLIGPSGANGTASINYAPGILFAIGPTTNDTTTPIVFRNNNAQERMRITAGGLVGIGTSAPQALLDVTGGPVLTKNIVFTTNQNAAYLIAGTTSYTGATTNFGTYGFQHRFKVDGSGIPRITVDGSSGEFFCINDSGRVGIGTTSPGANLDIRSNRAVNTYALTIGTTNGASFENDVVFTFDGSTQSIGNFQNFPLAFLTNNTERARIDSSGRLLVGTSSAVTTVISAGLQVQSSGASAYASIGRWDNNVACPGLILNKSRGSSVGTRGVVQSGDTLGEISFTGDDGTSFIVGAQILSLVDGTPGTNDMPGRLVFSTTADGASSPTERMRIGSTGIVTHNSNQSNGWALTTKNAGDNNDRFGLSIWCGTNAATGTNYAVEIADGDGTSQGFITFTGGTVTYGAFTAHHPCILPEEDNEDGYLYGTLLETVSIEYTQKDGVATERGIQYVVRKTQVCNSKAVLGAYGSSMNNGPTGATNLHQALVLGDGHILCNGIGGNIKAGDGICSSSVAGIGQKAIATPSMIIGIAQEGVTFEGNEVKLVAVQYGLQQFMPWQD